MDSVVDYLLKPDNQKVIVDNIYNRNREDMPNTFDRE